LDLPTGQQIIQACHAVWELVRLRGETTTPNLVLIGLPNRRSLEKTAAQLSLRNIPHLEWCEPDWNDEFTAIATAPLRGRDRDFFKKYRLYTPVAQLARASNSKFEDVGSTPTGSASASVAQMGEQRSLKPPSNRAASL
jgi:hypothetical protein